MEGEPVEVDQSALTGESLPVTRKPAKRFIRVRSSARVKSTLVYATGANITSARPRNWSRKHTPSAIFSARF